MGKIQINLLGTSFTIQAKENDDYLRKLLAYYKEITQTIQSSGHVRDALQASILAGITLVDELYKEKQRNVSYSKKIETSAEDSEKVQQITLDLIDTLDSAIND